MARYFTSTYAERAVLRDGSAVKLRLVTGDDRETLRRGFEGWSPESRYARFLAPKLSLTDDELRYLCDVDQETHFALGAVAEEGGAGWGVARFIRLPAEPGAPASAEAAVAVADEAHGKGLGTLLLLRLCAAAAERGVAQFRCEVLVTNQAMHALIDTIAPDRTIEHEGGVMTVDFAVGAIAPDAQATPLPPAGLFGLFRAAAGNVVEWTESVRRLWRR